MIFLGKKDRERLAEIKAQLDYHEKLLTEIYEAFDAARKGRSQNAAMLQNYTDLVKGIFAQTGAPAESPIVRSVTEILEGLK